MSERRAIDIALEIPPAHATATEAAEWARRLVAAVEREAAWLNDEREARAVAENSALKNMKTANEWRALAIDRGGIIEALKKQNAERLAAAEARAERLAYALRVYGRHGDNCRLFDRNDPCDCGLDAALTQEDKS